MCILLSILLSIQLFVKSFSADQSRNPHKGAHAKGPGSGNVEELDITHDVFSFVSFRFGFAPRACLYLRLG